MSTLLLPFPVPGCVVEHVSTAADPTLLINARASAPVRPWQGWHHHMALFLLAVWFLIGETHRGQQMTPALTLPHVCYGLSMLLLEVYCTPGVDDICRQVHRQVLRNESARFYHHRTRKYMPPRT